MDSCEELENGSNIAHYTVINVKGKGRYGIVYECIDKVTQEKVAIKQSQLNLEAEGISSVALREISMLNELKHENIVSLKKIHMQNQSLFLIFQLLDFDLGIFLDQMQKKPMSIKKIKGLLYQLVKAVQFCHNHRVIHRDIKPGNVLLKKDGRLKLGDFGLSRSFTYPIKPLSEEVVTLWYRAPQILLGSQLYGPPIDIWSVGCIFAELMFGEAMFQGTDSVTQVDKIFSMMGSPKSQVWPECAQMKNYNLIVSQYTNQHFQYKLNNSSLDEEGKELLRKMLALNPNQRINANEILKHPFFWQLYKTTTN